ncbi:hypothetical protein FRC01_006893, partial [Tulasnella sp. 417]
MSLLPIPQNSTQSPYNPNLWSSLGGKVDNTKGAVLSILKETAWPKEASNDAQALIQTMEAPLDLDNLPKDETQIPTEVKTSIKLLLRELENAHVKVRGESKKYGTRKKGFRKKVKKLFSRTDPSQCTEVLRSCRADVEESSTALKDLLSALNVQSKQRPLHTIEGDGGGDSAEIPNQPPPTATILDPSHPTAGFSLTPNPIQSGSPPDPPAAIPQVGQQASIQARKQKTSEDLLNGANKAFRFAEGISAALPVVGTYVGAVARVGLTVVEMIQAADDNDETAKRLGRHISSLSAVLERVSKQARQPEKNETPNEMDDLTRF